MGPLGDGQIRDSRVQTTAVEGVPQLQIHGVLVSCSKLPELDITIEHARAFLQPPHVSPDTPVNPKPPENTPDVKAVPMIQSPGLPEVQHGLPARG